MNAAGGALDTMVKGIPDGLRRTFVDWPAGDWLFYGVGDPSTDNSYNAAEANGNMTEVWKINVTTKQKQKVCSFVITNPDNNATQNKFWQIGITNDGLKAAIRPKDIGTIPYDGLFRFTFGAYSDGVVRLAWGDANSTSKWGCAVSISPDGAYTMKTSSHTNVIVYKWDNTEAATITHAQMAGWLNPGVQPFLDPNAGGGNNSNRWSCNDPKWICLQMGWNWRDCSQGSNQVLLNWVDHQVVRSTAYQFAGTDKIEQYETGDFWVGNVASVTGVASPSVARIQAMLLQKNSAISVFDMLGREIVSNLPQNSWDGKTLSGVALKRGVYFVQSPAANTVKTQKLVIK
jgi:hypothetical protein